jgi:cell division protein ZapD
MRSDDPELHLNAISLLFDIGDVTSRADLKSNLLKELDRQRVYLCGLRADQSVNSQALENVIQQIEECLTTLNNLIGKPNTLINENEWLSIIRSRLSVAGGTSPVDLPSLYSWQHLPAEQRRKQLNSYTPAFSDWKTTCDLFLKLLRQSGDSKTNSTPNGSFQLPLTGKTYQLIRVSVDSEVLIPEISANKHVLLIRFLQSSTTGKATAYTGSVDFNLTLCNL